MKIVMYTDGAARGNPGPAGAGVIICDENGALLGEHFRYLGTATNNAAEYSALIEGLKAAAQYAPCSISVRMDSELIVNQMRGKYRVKHPGLIGFYRTVCGLLEGFSAWDFAHIPREQNRQADALANKAIDSAAASRPSDGAALS